MTEFLSLKVTMAHLGCIFYIFKLNMLYIEMREIGFF